MTMAEGEKMKVETGPGELLPETAGKRLGVMDWVVMAAILAAVAVSYRGVVHGEFVYDDVQFVKENRVIRQVMPIKRFFTLREAYSPHGHFSVYRPLTPLSYAVELKFHGGNVEGFHVTNIVLHGMCAVLVFVVLRKMFGSPLAAGLPALLFAVDPANTESVSYIAQRAGLLSLLFFLIGFRLHQGAMEGTTRRNLMLAGVVAMYALSVFSKEMGITLPAVLLMYDFLLVERTKRPPRWDRLIYYGALAWVAVCYMLMRTHLLGVVAQQYWHGGTIYKNALLVLASLGFYTRLAFWPLNLSVNYVSVEPESLMEYAVLAGALSAAVLATGAVLLYRVDRRLTFGIGWFGVTLLPVVNIIPLAGAYNDRFLYAPLVGICMVVAGLLALAVMKWKRWGSIGAAAGCVLVALGIVGTVERNRDWTTYERLIQATLRVYPDNVMGLSEMGTVYAGRDDQKAREYWLKAVEVGRGYWYPRAQLGMSYFFEGEKLIRQGKVKEGEALYAKAFEQLSEVARTGQRHFVRAQAEGCLASIYEYRGDKEKAKEVLREALTIDPTFGAAYAHLARLLERGTEKEREEGLQMILGAHTRMLWDAKVAKAAAAMLQERQRHDEALEVLQQTIRALPADSPERRELTGYAVELKTQLDDAYRRMQTR